MDRKIVWTEKASGDIEALFRYIARRGPGTAARTDKVTVASGGDAAVSCRRGRDSRRNP